MALIAHCADYILLQVSAGGIEASSFRQDNDSSKSLLLGSCHLDLWFDQLSANSNWDCIMAACQGLCHIQCLPPTYTHICVSHIFGTFFILAVLYVTIIVLAHRHQRSLAMYGEAMHNIHTRHNLQMIKTCVMLVAIFAICPFPVAVMHNSSEDIPWCLFQLVASFLVFFNCGINCVT